MNSIKFPSKIGESVGIVTSIKREVKWVLIFPWC